MLSPVEQSIKRKIEAVGTPLKDWDINIYRGVLTGCNEAFIIDSEKREEILANCQTEDERQRTAELIRPILRGRDIKRYGYDWANLYLIATFPSRHYDIDRYPAVKQYLLSFGIERLEQTGKTIIPLRLFINEKGLAKLEIALCTGKHQYDKRQAIKERENKRDIKDIMNAMRR